MAYPFSESQRQEPGILRPFRQLVSAVAMILATFCDTKHVQYNRPTAI